jgi:hypothetical protein
MPKFIKKPIVIDAIKWTGENFFEILKLANGDDSKIVCNITDKLLTIVTLEGDMTASMGDWIIKGIKGEFYPIKNDIFLETYEEVIE